MPKLPGSYDYPNDHDDRMRHARARAQWELGNGDWALIILRAYMYPLQDSIALEQQKKEATS